MGLFDIFKKNTDTTPNELTCVINGTVVELSTVGDEVFSSGLMGVGVGIIPSGNNVVAPGPGMINFVFPAKHAIGLTMDNGAEIIIHVGIDTVNLNGKGFESFVTDGKKVKRGDLLLKVDLDLIKQAGYEATTMVIITNKDSFSDIKLEHGPKTICDTIISLIKS